MKTAVFLIGGVLIAYSLFLSEAAVFTRSGRFVDDNAYDVSAEKAKNCNVIYTVDDKLPIVVRSIYINCIRYLLIV